MALIDFLLGRRLSNREHDTRKIGWFEAVPAMGLDGLGSASYGPEAALTILMAPIVALLAMLYVSYRKTIMAYPSNGGAYTVSRENLGRNASLLAAAALMVRLYPQCRGWHLRRRRRAHLLHHYAAAMDADALRSAQ